MISVFCITVIPFL